MITLRVTNRHVVISGASLKVTRAIGRLTSYKIAGSHFSPAFRAKRWYGKEHLLQYAEPEGYFAPAGLAIDIARELKRMKLPYKVVNERYAHHERVDIAWNPDIQLRPYQLAAVDSIFNCQMPGLGILKMPIRSGKTKTAAEVIRRIGRPGVFGVPSQMLLEQTVASLRESLPGLDIGYIGDSEYKDGFFIVAMLQSLARWRGKRSDPGKKNGRPMDPRYKELIHTRDVFSCDEAHHIRGEGEWYKIPYDFDAMFKVALSATVFLDDVKEAERGIIWLKGVFGPVRTDLSMSDLIEAGYLMRQNVKMYRITTPTGFKTAGWSDMMRSMCLTNNDKRNSMIARLARKASVDMGMKVLILARELEHINTLRRWLDSVGVPNEKITGRERKDKRRALIERMLSGEFNVLIGTVLGEGVDIPAVECVINAEGGRDIKRAIQRQRNLTMAEGKRVALFIDFMDETNHYLEEHSQARLEAYQSEPAFLVEVRN